MKAYFDSLYARGSDPWDYRRRWYEARKRALMLACLPRQRYRAGFEPGCANGELAAALAARCDSYLAADFHPVALAAARERLAGQPHVRVAEARMPDEWPAAAADGGRFDLVVLSEFGYYLDGDALAAMAWRCRETLEAGGTVIGCHWRRPIDGCVLDGDGVHRILARALALPVLACHREDDFRLDVWSSQPAVAQEEGLA
ncbi:methyltransferase [Aquincola sp. MAHUQ-54]|uniref:Methyltransferase n=1 Tax=Aquincola agrisoli TaxID=3119538 RepID=A0AAW9QL71_9BURK